MKNHTYATNSRRGLFALVLAAMLALFSGSAWAGDINGVVIDANNGSFLRGADVRISELGRVTSTGRTGDFSFDNVPAGAYTIAVNYIGYDGASETVQVPATGSVTPRITIGSAIVELEEFRIEGYREGKSLAIQQKKTSGNLRDIISSDSIGNLPDANVADALVRVPGVSINLEQGEGRFVSIRGVAPELNNVTINGASVANPSVSGRRGRAVPLDVVGSSQVTQLEVIKAQTPDMDAQGLGGTVNIITASGFDRESAFFTGSAETGESSVAKKNQRKVQATYGATIGAERKLAVAFSASYEFRPIKTENVDIRYRDNMDADIDNDGVLDGDFVLPSSIEKVPEDAARRRMGFNAKVEWRPNEDTELAFNLVYSDYTEWEREVEDIFEVEQRRAVFLTPTTGFYQGADAQIRAFNSRRNQELLNMTFNGKRKFGNLTLMGEYTFTESIEDEPRDNNIQFRSRLSGAWVRKQVNDTTQYSYGAGLRVREFEDPITEIDGVPIPVHPNICGGDGVCDPADLGDMSTSDDDFLGDPIPIYFDISNPETVFSMGGREDDPSRYFHLRNQINTSFVTEETHIPKFDVRYDMDNFMGSDNSGFVQFGFKYFDRTRTVDDKVHRRGLASEPTLVEQFDENGNLITDIDGNPILTETDLFVQLSMIPRNPDNFPAANATVPGRQNLSYNTGIELDFDSLWNDYFFGGTEHTPFNLNETLENNTEDAYTMTEEITALYGMFDVDIGEKLKVIGGVRFEKTKALMQAFQFTEGEGVTKADDIITELTVPFDYDSVHPSFQILYRFSDNLQMRASYTSTIGRPDFEDLAPISVLEWEFEDEGNNIIAGGVETRNPTLVPYESDNFDVSLEYYLRNGGSVSVAFFHKAVDNPIYDFGDFTENVTVAEAIAFLEENSGSPFNPVLIPEGAIFESFSISGKKNADSGKITGVEVSGYLPLTFLPAPLDGFGVDANLSFIDSSVEIIGREGQDFPFFEQPDFIGNAAVFYQKGKFAGRVAWRHQKSQLDEVRSSAPVDYWSAKRTQWDAQVSYRLNDNWTVYANFANFTNETDDRIQGNDYSTLKDREKFGATYTAGIRWNF